jgi:hypothetical protein
MSYFKPLNSPENNLHFIRLSVTNNGTKIYPPLDQLPYIFTLQPSFSFNQYLTVYYQGLFDNNDIPSVFVSSNVQIPSVITKTDGGFTFEAPGLNYLPDLDIYIIGKKASGPVYAISNKGWNFTTRSIDGGEGIHFDNIVYSNMLIGINNISPTFNLSHSGNIGFIPNELNSNRLDVNLLKNKNLNLIDIDVTNSILIPSPALTITGLPINGQSLDLCISNVIDNSSLILNPTNFSMTKLSSITLKSIGDSVSLHSYNNKWIITNKNINKIIPAYNIIYTNMYYDPSIYLNGNVSILKLGDYNASINLPSSNGYDGKYVEMFVQSNTPSSHINFILSNITCSKNSIVFKNIGDHVKLIGYKNKWLLVESIFN